MRKVQLPLPQKISSGDHSYPERMRVVFGGLLPPDIWFIGNADILELKGVGFCGSRNASETGLSIAADCAKQLSEQNLTVISGYAAGVDMARSLVVAVA